MLRSSIGTLAALALLSTISSGARADPIFNVTDLGKVYASSLNDAGQVIGSGLSPANGAPSGPGSGGFLIDTSGPNAGTLYAFSNFQPAAINASGLMAGSSVTPSEPAFVYANANGAVTPIQGSGPVDSGIISINASGQVLAGYYQGQFPTNDGGQWPTYHTYVYSPDGTQMYIGTPPNTNSFLGVGINNSGQIAGTAGSFDTAQAFFYSGGVFHSLGTLPGDYSSAADGINNAGQVVGNSDGASGSHPFLYSNGTMQALGSLGGASGFAEGIGNNGEVWGMSYTAGGTSHEFLYIGGQMLDLTNMLHSLSSSISQYSSYTVEGINSQGQILVQAWNSATDYRSFLLTPEGQPLPTAPDSVQIVPVTIGSDPVQAPEPSALALLIGGIIAYGARRGMRRTPRLA